MHWGGAAPRGSQCNDHSGDCSIASHNEFRYINNDAAADFVSESNKDQGTLTGGFTSYIDNDHNGKISVGDTIFWYTDGKTNGVVDNGRWNHWGIVQVADVGHPNRS